MTAGRVAVVLDGDPAPAWQAEALRRLEEAPDVDVVEVRVGRRRADDRSRALVRRVEHRLLGAGRDPLRPTRVQLRPRPDGTDAHLLEVRLDAGAPDPDVRSLRLEHDADGPDADGAFARAGRAGAPGVTTRALLRTAPDDDRIAAETTSGARATGWVRPGEELRWKLPALVLRAVRAAADAGGLDSVEGPPRTASAAPTGPAPVRWAHVLLVRLAFRRPWRLRVRAASAAGPLEAWDVPTLVRGRPGHTYADPMLLEVKGRAHLLCEEVPLGAARGVISHADLGLPDPVPEPVLEAAHHLSYPFVVREGDDVLVVPETTGARRVELWRATRFPDAWELEAVLLDDLALADATLLEHGGRWWLFGTVAEPGASLLDELHLFSAPALRGPWTPHPQNPVVSDVRCARPAGPFLRDGGRLLRPAQDGSRRYGGALRLQEVVELSQDRYLERPAGELRADGLRGVRAVHHLSAAAGLEAIDVRVREPRSRLLRRLRPTR